MNTTSVSAKGGRWLSVTITNRHARRAEYVIKRNEKRAYRHLVKSVFSGFNTYAKRTSACPT